MTGLEVIRDALSLTNAVGVDMQLTSDETQSALRAFNRQLENWSTQDLAVYGLASQTFTTVNGQSTYTIGVGGNWNTVRPIRINDPAYSVYQNVSFPCLSMTQGEYDLIPFKAQTQEFPNRYLYVNEYPLGLITLWPVPNQATPITFSIDRILTTVTNLAAQLSFPPGYEEAFVYNLAVRLGPMFGRQMSGYPDVVEKAKTSLGDIKRANRSQRQRVMAVGPEYSDSNYSYWGWQVWP